MKIKDVVQLAKQTDFIFALDTFLDEFKHSEDKLSALIDEPPGSQFLSQEEYSILSAVAEKLANDLKFKLLPSWILKKEYFLKDPAFQFKTKDKDYQKFLIKNAIPEFAKRNLFYDFNSINRT